MTTSWTPPWGKKLHLPKTKRPKSSAMYSDVLATALATNPQQIPQMWLWRICLCLWLSTYEWQAEFWDQRQRKITEIRKTLSFLYRSPLFSERWYLTYWNTLFPTYLSLPIQLKQKMKEWQWAGPERALHGPGKPSLGHLCNQSHLGRVQWGTSSTSLNTLSSWKWLSLKFTMLAEHW